MQKQEIFRDTFRGSNANYITMAIELSIVLATDQDCVLTAG